LESTPEINILSPKNTAFDADRYFLLEADNLMPEKYKYIALAITYYPENRDEDIQFYHYAFAGAHVTERVWLRYGRGDYIIHINVHTPTTNENYGSSDYFRDIAKLSVFNTREDEAPKSDQFDRRFILPSPNSQSDELIVLNAAREGAYGKSGDTETIRGIHDYLIRNTVYNQASADGKVLYTDDGQIMGGHPDAYGTLTHRYFVSTGDLRFLPEGHLYAICTGYSYTFSALVRSVGYEARTVSKVGHFWNHVYTGGAWKLVDTTWDDVGEGYYKYFLLPNLNGINNDHYSAVSNGWQIEPQ
jgi:hypothetical protein